MTLEKFNAGAANNLRSKFLKEVSKSVIGDFRFLTIQPNVKHMDSVAWSRCLCFVVAYLRRYKMDNTLQTMKAECPILPKNTGFQRASDLELFLRTIKKTSIIVSDQTFDERVIDFKDKMMKDSGNSNKSRLSKRKK
jgi:hypothetical protein